MKKMLKDNFQLAIGTADKNSMDWLLSGWIWLLMYHFVCSWNFIQISAIIFFILAFLFRMIKAYLSYRLKYYERNIK